MAEFTTEQLQAIAIAKARQRQAQMQQGTAMQSLQQPTERSYRSATPADFIANPDQFAGQDFTQKPGWQLPYPPGMTKSERELARKSVVPAMAVAGAVPSGGTSLMAIGGAALGAGIGGTGGAMIEQKLEGKPIDLEDALKTGAKEGAVTAAGGLTFKALGALAGKVFSPVAPELEQAARYAKENNVPLPATVDKGKLALMGKSVEAGPTLGRYATIQKAKEINNYINRYTQQLTQDSKIVDDVGQKGQQFFSNIFKGEQEAAQGGFEQFLAKIGPDTLVPATSVKEALQVALAQMKSEIGLSKGPIVSRMKTMLKEGADAIPISKLDEFRKDLGALLKASKTKSPTQYVKDVQDAILRDYDVVSAPMGFSATDMARAAIEKYAKFGGVKKSYPWLERFGKDFGERGSLGGSRNWFEQLFTENNAGALNYIKRENPQLFNELADTHLASLLTKARTAKTDMFGEVLDGQKLLTELTNNKALFTKIYGADKYQGLVNFANYVKMVGQPLATKGFSATEIGVRTPAMVGAMAASPWVYLPTETSAYFLAKGLNNPNSILIRNFMGKNFDKLSKGLTKLIPYGTRMGPLADQLMEARQKHEKGNVGKLELFGNF